MKPDPRTPLRKTGSVTLFFLWLQHAYLYKMVAQNLLRTYDENYVFTEKKIGFDDSFDVTKCLQIIEMPDLLHMCAE